MGHVAAVRRNVAGLVYHAGFVPRYGVAPTAIGFGDSITVAHSLPERRTAARDSYYDRLVLRGLVRSLGNAGIRGQKTDAMLARFDRDVIERRPDLLFLTAGTNDVLSVHRFPHERTLANVARMVDAARESGATVLLGALPPANSDPTRVREYNALLSEWANTERVPVMDFWTALAGADGCYRESFTRDGLHPNVRGAKAMEAVAVDALAGVHAPG